MMLDLFDFQTDAKNYLLDKTTDPNAKRKIIVKSPTGSGKTIILLSYIYDYLLLQDPNKVFIWLTSRLQGWLYLFHKLGNDNQ